MPTYDYRCEACGHQFEQFQSISAKALVKCPECGQRALQRLIGTGGGVIFRGSGFYQTDYRSDSYRKAAAAESKGPADTSDAQQKKSAGAASPPTPGGDAAGSGRKSTPDTPGGGAKKSSAAAAAS